MAISAAVEALLQRILDYAGLFPPARLPLEAALKAYLAYREGPDAWMLGRFILPMDRVVELDPLLKGVARPVALSVLTPREESPGAFMEALKRTLASMEEAEVLARGEAVPEIAEGQVPPAMLPETHPEHVAEWMEEVSEHIGTHLPDVRRMYWEVSLQGNWSRALDRFMEAATLYQARRPALACGFKLRCGGEVAEAFPSVEQVATAVVLAREAEIPMKATAGLHQPFRYYDADLGVYHHGFINLFLGGILARTYRLSIDELVPLLAEEDPDAFGYDAEHVWWRGMRATREEIKEGRATFMHAFGSCSFDEPREALREHGWLPPMRESVE